VQISACFLSLANSTHLNSKVVRQHQAMSASAALTAQWHQRHPAMHLKAATRTNCSSISWMLHDAYPSHAVDKGWQRHILGLGSSWISNFVHSQAAHACTVPGSMPFSLPQFLTEMAKLSGMGDIYIIPDLGQTRRASTTALHLGRYSLASPGQCL